MVSIEEGANELFGLLYCLVYSDTLLYQFQRVNHESYPTDHLPITIMFFHKLIKLILIVLWNNVPDLPRPCMAVI